MAEYYIAHKRWVELATTVYRGLLTHHWLTTPPTLPVAFTHHQFTVWFTEAELDV